MSEVQENDLRLFIDLLDEFAEEDCEFTDKPDMLVERPGARIGVEHTRLYQVDPASPKGRQLKPQERIQFQISQRAFELFREQSSTPLYLTVTFDEPYDYKPRDVSSVAAALATVVLQSMSLVAYEESLGRKVIVEAWDFQRRGLPFPNGVRSFHYSVQQDEKTELWAPSYAYMVPHVSVSDI